MKLEDKHERDALVVTVLDKRLDAGAVDDFRKKMSQYIENGEESIVLNLSNVEFIDSSGLGAIVGILKMMKDPGKIVICGAADSTMRMFKLTRMNKVFNMFENEKEAVDALSV
jgi:anti-sigma B factor antagonist